DAHERRARLQLGEAPGSDISHAGTQAADELVQHRADRALIGHLPFDALRHELQRVLYLLLEIAVRAAARHGSDRAHAAVSLVGPPLIEVGLARALVGARKQRADHDRFDTGRERLRDIT